ncbi:MAG TPA: hypothetical protein VFJ16_27665, partial [Longimicrobium sp.]|nr:hypothetical protein [Longimicrobium sp.]
MRRSLILLAALSLAAAPAAAQDRTTFAAHGSYMTFRAESQFARVVVPYTVDQVWAALPDAYKLLGFTGEPASNDPAKRDLVTGYMQIRGQLYPGEPNSLYFDCGNNARTGPLADQGEITFAVYSRLEPAAEQGRTAVLSQVSARVKRRDSSQFPVDCISTGRLERTLAQFLAQRLAASG